MFLISMFALLQVGCQLVLPQLTDDILNYGVAENDFAFIMHTGLKMPGMTVLVGICAVIGGYFSARRNVPA